MAHHARQLAANGDATGGKVEYRELTSRFDNGEMVATNRRGSGRADKLSDRPRLAVDGVEEVEPDPLGDGSLVERRDRHEASTMRGESLAAMGEIDAMGQPAVVHGKHYRATTIHGAAACELVVADPVRHAGQTPALPEHVPRHRIDQRHHVAIRHEHAAGTSSGSLHQHGSGKVVGFGDPPSQGHAAVAGHPSACADRGLHDRQIPAPFLSQGVPPDRAALAGGRADVEGDERPVAPYEQQPADDRRLDGG